MAEESHDFPQVAHILIVSTRCIASVVLSFPINECQMHRKTINFAIRFNEKRKTKENKHVMQKHIRTNGSSHVSSLVVELERDLQTTSGFLNFYVIRIAVSVFICCCCFFFHSWKRIAKLIVFLCI